MHHLELGQLTQLLGSVEDHLSALSDKDTLVRVLLLGVVGGGACRVRGANRVVTENRPHQMRTVCLKRMKVMIALTFCCP